MKQLFWLALVGMLWFLAGCKHQQTTDGAGEIKFTVIDQGQYSGMEEPEDRFISDGASWEAVWSVLQKGVMPRPTLPEVNFETHTLIACGMGTKTSGGYNIQVDKVEKKEAVITVSVVNSEPGENCLRTSALTQPYVVIKLKKQPATASFSFSHTTATTDCR
ncbi:MAG: protease complex subunit PrcB family protein [Bacteroidota bacterium]